MRILYITNGINGSGGLERVLSVKTSYLAEHFNHEITIVTLNEHHPKSFYSFSRKVRLYSIKVEGNPYKYFTLYRQGLIDIIKEVQPDLISVCDDGLKGFFIPSLIPVKIPIIYERHASIFLNTDNSLKGKTMRFLMRYLSTKFDRFVVLTNSNKLEWKGTNVISIPNPLSFFPVEKAKLDRKKVIAVGTHTYNKGYDLLLQSWKNITFDYPDWQLHIYGKSDIQKTYIILAEKLKVHHSVFFHEPLDNIMDKYLESSIMVLPSRSEGFGMVLIEAMSCGVPCISFDCPSGPRDIITNDEDGFLISNGNTSELSIAIKQLMDNPDLLVNMGESARKNVKRYMVYNIALMWHELFKEIVE